MFYSNFVLKTDRFEILELYKYTAILKTGLGVYSRSSEPKRIVPPPMTSYQRSIVTMGLSRTVSEINGDVSRKLQIFPTAVYFAPPMTGFPLELDISARRQKLEGPKSFKIGLAV